MFRSRKFSEFPSMKEAMISRDLEATFMIVPLAMKLVADGVPVKIVYLGHRDGSALMVGTEGDIRDFKDLKGKTCAIPSRFSNQYLLLRRMMKKNDMQEGDIRFLEMPPPDMPAALAAKAIDSYIVGEPHAARAEVGGWGRPLYFMKDLWPDFISCGLVVRQELIDEQREIVQELVNGIAASGMWLDEDVHDGAEHRKLAAQVAGTVFYNQDPKLLEFVLTRPLDRVSYQKLKPPRETFDEIMDLAVETGVMARRMAFEEYVDTSFAPDLERVTRVEPENFPLPTPGDDKP
jgi:NitT/TauT family transport system substrate-binding protein